MISENHGHALAVPASDFPGSGDKIYGIQGTSVHSHHITLTEAQRAQLLAGASAVVTSTLTLAHTHQVTVVCA